MSDPQRDAPPSNAANFVPPPRPARSGIALCMSGGGYRAALFHLGAVRRLNELGVLGRIDVFSSVSGGSIFAAFLATRWGAMTGGRFADFHRDVAAPFRAFTKHDIRTTPALRRLLPWEWANAGAQAEGLQAQYEHLLVTGKRLSDLPASPRFVFCATDLAFGVNWEFSRDRVGDYQAGYRSPAAVAATPLAQAVAASSCFPPAFKPMPLKLDPGDLTGGKAEGTDRDACVRAVALTDGGVYDNMGLEPVWKTVQTVLVCDGGKPFRFTKNDGTADQLLRINDLMGNQAEAVRKRWLIASYTQGVYDGTYWGIDSSVEKYDVPDAIGYSEALADEVVSAIRTDMDTFSDDEADVLETHGYTLADVALRKHAPALYPDPAVSMTPPAPALWPTTDPGQRHIVEDRIRRLLADSAHIHAWGHSAQ